MGVDGGQQPYPLFISNDIGFVRIIDVGSAIAKVRLSKWPHLAPSFHCRYFVAASEKLPPIEELELHLVGLFVLLVCQVHERVAKQARDPR